jgi:hypothetical protein
MIRLAADTSRTGVTFDSSLWWRGPNIDGGSYHYLTGTGIDVISRQVFFADPDSNKGNSRTDAGWNFSGTDAAVDARKYTAADSAVPIPSRGVNLTDDPVAFDKFYGAITISADGYKITDSERYHDVTIRRIETISPLVAGVVIDGINRPNIGILSTLVAASGPNNTVDKVIFFPTSQVVADLAAESKFEDPNDMWSVAQYLIPDNYDLFGNLRHYGGVEFDLLSGIGLSPGEIANVVIGTKERFTDFDVFMHIKNCDSDDWLIQAIGAPELLSGNQQTIQQAIPEPTSLLLLVSGCLIFGGCLWLQNLRQKLCF